jgi:hypothetical protein
MGISRARVSQIEKAACEDIHLSVLNSYMNAIGLRLAVIVPEASKPKEIIVINEPPYQDSP